MHVVKEEDGRLLSVAAEEKQVFSGVALKILKSLAEGQKYPKEIARELRVHEQKVYYHIHRLEKRGFIQVERKEERGGALAKLYRLSSPAFVVRFAPWQDARSIPRSVDMAPFIVNGRLNATIIVGSSEPHGPERARSRDVAFAVDLALFLGSFLTRIDEPAVLEDKDAHWHDLNANLILIGGPVTNKVTKMVNDRLPARFDKNKNIVAKKLYKQDECGFIAKAENPFHAGKKVMVLAGKRYFGTKAAVLAFMRKFDEIGKKSYAVVEGIDNDADGEVDDVRIVEVG